MADAKIPNADRPAFPLEYAPAMGALRGLSKLEAVAALNHAALLANPDFLAACGRNGMRAGETEPLAAQTAVRHAKALLAELGEPIP